MVTDCIEGYPATTVTYIMQTDLLYRLSVLSLADKKCLGCISFTSQCHMALATTSQSPQEHVQNVTNLLRNAHTTHYQSALNPTTAAQHNQK